MSSSLPLVSVIVPVHNAQQHLERCVRSILAQTYAAIEVILIDDGSTDDSGPLCDRLAQADPRVAVHHQPNGGIASAQNRGLESARGTLVTFCDNDDLMSPHLIQRLVDILIEADADMSCCRWLNPGASSLDRVFEDAPPVDITTITIDDPATAYQTVFPRILRRARGTELRYFSEANWGKMYRADLFRDLRFPDGRFAQDVFIAMDLYGRMRRVASTAEPLYAWVQHGESVSHSRRSAAYYCDIVEAHARCFERALELGILPARAYFGLGALVFERRAARTPAERYALAQDEERVRLLKKRLTPRQRLQCELLRALRRVEVVVYNRTIHRRR